MVKLHTLKIAPEFARVKIDGEKPFEIRKNDRDFEVGDIIRYIVPEKYLEDGDIEEADIKILLEERLYKIIYITDYEQKDGYVVFAERRLK